MSLRERYPIFKSLPLVLSMSLLALAGGVHADYSFETEWGPYYSNFGYYQSLTDHPIPDVVIDDETTIYNRMLDSAFTLPRFMLVKVGVYPLPVLGVYTKKSTPIFMKTSV